MIVENFTHEKGRHCGSVAMADLLRWAGEDLSEPMVFGLGAGLGFYYLQGEGFSPSRQIVGRSMNLEEQAADALGLTLRRHVPEDADAAWGQLRQTLEQGRPVMLQCDLSKLPYWETDTPFAGHRIVVAGWEPEADEVLVADTHFPGLQSVARQDLRRARSSTDAPAFEERFTWWELEPGEARPVEEAVQESLEVNENIMEEDPTGVGGLEALESFAAEVGNWREREDAVWCYRFAYQVIEKRGTGGGNFRNLYRDYLHEVSELVPSVGQQQLAISMTRTADAWSTLATYLNAMALYLETGGEKPGEDPSHHVESMAEAVYQFESTFWDRIGA